MVQARPAVPARIIEGKRVALEVEQEVAAEIARLSFRPGLVAVRVGNDPASEIYVRSKAKKAEELGLRGTQKILPDTTSEADLLAEVDRLNRDPEVDGILVQLPLPRHIDARKVIDAIDPMKDVDGFHPTNVGRLHLGRTVLAPCTPAAPTWMCCMVGGNSTFATVIVYATVVPLKTMVALPVPSGSQFVVSFDPSSAAV